MQNPMLAGLNKRMMSQNIGQIKGMMNTLRSAGNPQMMLNQMMSQNPQIKEVMDYVRQNGGDAKAAFYKLADEQGVNPDEILGMLK